MTASPSPDHFVKLFQFTKKNYREVYPALKASVVDSQVGKTVIVTGASQGIGKAIAIEFAKASASNIVLASRSIAKLEATKAEILEVNNKANVLVLSIDITSEADVQKLEQAVKDNFGHADVLVNNSGQWAGRGNIGELNVKAWWSDFVIKFFSFLCLTVLASQAFLRLLPKSQHGSVITVGKLALNRFNEYLSLENPNVRAVVYHPGTVLTPIMDDLPEFKPFALDTPELAGAFAVYLTTKRAEYLNGRFVSVNWDIEELEARRDEIALKGLMTEGLKGVFSA